MLNLDCSVIVPTFNRAATLPRAIDSVLCQSLPASEVIVVDDGSTDDTADIISGYGSRVIALPQRNSGASAARNAGARRASRQWLAFHDSDDCWLPHKLQTIAEQLALHSDEASTDIRLIFSSFTRYEPAGHQCELMPASSHTDKPSIVFQSPVAELDLARRNCIGAPTLLVDRELFHESGGFDESLPSLEDWEFVIRLAKFTPFLFVAEPLVLAYAQSGSVNNNVESAKQAKLLIRKRHEDIFRQFGKRRLKFLFRRQ